MTRNPPFQDVPDDVGEQMHDLMADLYGIHRSITGDGVRRTLEVLGKRIALDVHEVPSGTEVLDWTVPPEWNLREAFIEGPDGERVVDAADSNLHVVSYSDPVDVELPLDELRTRVHTLPDRPDWIPYRVGYYDKGWGFCMRHRRLESLEDGTYRARIDASVDEEGHLTYGEAFVPGERDDEVLVSTYVCHPSLCNDNLSGVVLTAFLAEQMEQRDPRLSYRFLFVPETIGAITWLSRNQDRLDRVRHGLVVTCVGDPGPMTYKRTRSGDRPVDRIVERVLKERGHPYDVLEFFPSGSDERQYCSPGFDLPVGALMRTPPARFPEYHTSADDLDLVTPDHLADSFRTYLRVFGLMEADRTYVNLRPRGEPQLSKRRLHVAVGARSDVPQLTNAMLWVLNLSDGDHSVVDISRRADLPFDSVREAAELLERHDLLEDVGADDH